MPINDNITNAHKLLLSGDKNDEELELSNSIKEKEKDYNFKNNEKKEIEIILIDKPKLNNEKSETKNIERKEVLTKKMLLLKEK